MNTDSNSPTGRGNINMSYYKIMKYYCYAVLAIALFAEIGKLSSKSSSEKRTLSVTSHTCLGLLFLLGLIQMHFTDKFNKHKKTVLALCVFAALMIAFVAVEQKHTSDADDIREGLSYGILAFIIILLVARVVKKKKSISSTNARVAPPPS